MLCLLRCVPAAYRPSLPLVFLEVRFGACSIMQSHVTKPKGSGSCRWGLSDMLKGPDVAADLAHVALAVCAQYCTRISVLPAP